MINILIIVDVEHALSNEGPPGNVWMVDTGKFGSTQESGIDMITTANVGDTLSWFVVPIDPATASDVTWLPPVFSGPAVPNNINPKPVPNTGQYNAQFLVPAGTPAGTKFQYNIGFQLDSSAMGIDAFILLANAA